MLITTRSPVFRPVPMCGVITGHLRSYRYAAWLHWVWMWG